MGTSDYSLERGITHCKAPAVKIFLQAVVFYFLMTRLGVFAALVIRFPVPALRLFHIAKAVEYLPHNARINLSDYMRLLCG